MLKIFSGYSILVARLYCYDYFEMTCNNLRDDNLKGLSDTEVWNLLDGKLFGYHGDIEIEDNRSLEEIQSDSLKFNRFIFLTNWGEQFDRGEKSFIYESDNNELKIYNYRYFLNKKIVFSVSKTDILKAINSFTKWFDDQTEILK